MIPNSRNEAKPNFDDKNASKNVSSHSRAIKLRF